MKQFKSEIIARCKAADACRPEFKRLLEAKTDAEFLRVLTDNHTWCVSRNIYTPDEIEALPVGALQSAGIATQAWLPIDFTAPQEVAGVLWEPLNVGATLESPAGEYLTFEQANDPERGLKAPTAKQLHALDDAGSQQGVYLGHFGRVFGGKIFLPAVGNRYTAGQTYNVGTRGHYWSATPNTAAWGYFLLFYGSTVLPMLRADYRFGFTVRCVR